MYRYWSCWRRLNVVNIQFYRHKHRYSGLNQQLLKKTLDRIHRLNYYALTREVHKYNKTKIEISSNLQDLLIYIRAEKEGNLNNIGWKFFNSGINVKINNKNNSNNNNKLLEFIVFNIILSLYNFGNINTANVSLIRNQTLQRENFMKNLLKITNNHNHPSQLLLNQLLNKFELNPQHDQCLNYSLACLQYCSTRYYGGKYDNQDFLGWIQSICSGTVIDACEHLTSLSNIPSFVLMDIILRTPLLKQEFQLQYDLWIQFLKPIIVGYIDKPTKIKACFNNLIFYCIHHNPSSLLPLLSTTISFLIDPKSGCQNSIITPKYINELLWDLALLSVRDLSNHAINSVIKSQELLIKYLGDKPYKNLNLKGYMAISMAINSKSPQKSLQIFKIAEERFNKPSNSKELSVYTVVKTYLSTTPEELLINFNSAATNYCHLTMLWLVFIKKLDTFSLLNEIRSVKLIEEMMKYKETLLITKDLIAILIHPIKSMSNFDKFIKLIDQELLHRFNNIFIPKYMSMLYKNYKIADFHHYWQGDDIHSSVEYARYLYKEHLQKSTRNIGIMLQGEAIRSPEHVYQIYQDELGDRAPDSGCIFALMKAAMKTDIHGNVIVWGNLFAPQVAVHIFKVNTAKLKQDNTSIYPDSRLWQQYIRLLSKYGYLSELSEIIQWWEKLSFEPDSKLLLLLLNSLPIEHAKRYIRHYEKVRSDSVKFNTKETKINDTLHWPWPTVEELDIERT